jgi:hypothetical protein
MERVLTYGFAYKLNENGWKGDPDGRIPLLEIKKAIIVFYETRRGKSLLQLII